MASVITRTHRKDVLHVQAKATASKFSTLTPKNVWMAGHEQSSDRDGSRPRIQLTMCPNQMDTARQYATSSFEESPQYAAGWSNALRQSPSTRITNDVKPTLNPVNNKDGEFDPILDIRAMNPLIFESNYDLEEYGPSFKAKEDDQATLIQEWRIRHDNVA